MCCPRSLPCLMVLLLALGGSVPGASADAPLPPCVASRGDFLAVTEYVVIDVIDPGPSVAPGRTRITVRDYLRGLGTRPAPAVLNDEWLDAELIHIGSQWLVVRSYRSYVRAAAIGMIDDRPGSLHLLPATPVVPGGAQVLAQPAAIGVTLVVGTARCFCGVRSAARSLSLSSSSLGALATLVQAPTAATLLADLPGASDLGR